MIAAIARSCHSGLVLFFSRASKYISFCNSSFCWSWSFLSLLVGMLALVRLGPLVLVSLLFAVFDGLHPISRLCSRLLLQPIVFWLPYLLHFAMILRASALVIAWYFWMVPLLYEPFVFPWMIFYICYTATTPLPVIFSAQRRHIDLLSRSSLA